MGSNSKAVVVFSGGQDSTTCLFWALDAFESVAAITFDYGQRHSVEIVAAEKIANLAGIEWEVLPLSGFSLLGRNSLTGPEPVTKEKSTETGLPKTFVPGRNLIFLTYAAAYAYSNEARHLVGGMCETDYSGYPDCRRTTLDRLMEAINLGMESDLELHTPLMQLTKAESVQLAMKVGAMEALSWSHTCYNGEVPPCGKCAACELRAKGFEDAAVKDPLLVRLGHGI